MILSSCVDFVDEKELLSESTSALSLCACQLCSWAAVRLVLGSFLTT